MNVYTCSGFEGRYPVGTSAVIVAESKDHAAELLEKNLERIGFKQKIDQKDIRLVSTTVPHVVILNDGDY